MKTVFIFKKNILLIAFKIVIQSMMTRFYWYISTRRKTQFLL